MMRPRHVVWMLWALALLIVGGAVLIGARRATAEVPWTTDLAGALARAKASGRPVMIDFWAEWCGYCKAMDRTTYRDDEVRKLAAGFECVRVNADERKDVARRYGARVLPVVVFLHPSGRTVSVVPGYVPAEELTPAMHQALEAAAAGRQTP